MPALADGVEHYRLIQAERELLEGTVRGSVTLLTEILGIKDPVAANRGARLKRHVRGLAAELEITGSWDFEVAAMLSQIGYAVVPGDIVDRWRAGGTLATNEQQLLASHSQVAKELLANIPRLDTVAEMRYGDGGHSEEIMRALDRVAVASGGYLEKSLAVQDLVSGLILAADLYATDGRLLLTKGTELSLAARTRINQYADHVGIREPIQVRVPL